VEQVWKENGGGDDLTPSCEMRADKSILDRNWKTTWHKQLVRAAQLNFDL
jgi:hypothetical protein